MMTLEAEQVTTKKIRLSDARSELHLTQQRLKELSGVSTKVISNIEQKRSRYPIRRLTAYALLGALNEERSKRGKTELSIDDVDWKISGDGEGDEKQK